MTTPASTDIGIPFCDECGRRATPESGINLHLVVVSWQALSVCDDCLNHVG
jgi:hypothetical protein